MKILIAPDSFKGGVTAKEAAQAMMKGIRRVEQEAKVKIIPMADGGEGTSVSLIEATNGTFEETEVEDPLGRTINGRYGITGDGQTAVIELASASGLNTLTKDELAPCSASTYGTGQLILHALNKGIHNFIICLGGSATNDGGSGILKALGFRFLDNNGSEIRLGGLGLQDVVSIDESRVHPSAREATFQIACDVNNPFIGANGASAVFGPQKGATLEMVQGLDEALTVFADCIERNNGQSIHQIPGAGAAGGAAGGLLALLNAELKPGIKVVMDAVHFEDFIQQDSFDLLLTGEGKIDGQTASGKVVAGLAEVAKQYHLPTVALAGTVEGDLDPLYERGLTTAFSITNGPMSLEEAMKNSRALIERKTEQIFRLLRFR